MLTEAPATTRILEITDRLCAEYGCPIPWFHHMDPLSELISSGLNHQTRNADSSRAFKALRDRFPTWEEVRTAPVAEIEALIQSVRWPELKAPRLQQILNRILERHGSLTLDFLADMPVKQARAWLEGLPGVGRKTSAACLLFSTLRMLALPIDSHHHRVAQRLRLIPASMAVGPAHDALADQLPPDWTSQHIYDNHEVLMIHGQCCCFASRTPACHRCVLLDLCPTGQTNLRHPAA